MDKRKEKANPLIFILVCLFASSAWLGSYASWVEMGVFTQKLPEGWALGSIITIVIQVCNFFKKSHKNLIFSLPQLDRSFLCLWIDVLRFQSHAVNTFRCHWFFVHYATFPWLCFGRRQFTSLVRSIPWQ